MKRNFNIYAPAKCTFENYFLPRVQKPALDHFEVDKKRYGIQRKGNNHLVVFLDYHGKKNVAKFSEVGGGEQGEFFTKPSSEAGLFATIFSGHGEVAVYSISYSLKMSVFAWKLLSEVVDDAKVLVEDDSGHLMTGPDCAKAMRELLKQD